MFLIFINFKADSKALFLQPLNISKFVPHNSIT